jgi:Aldo/keto reductase family
VPLEESAATLAGFRREGKIRAIGVSNFSPAQMDRSRSAAPLSAVQPPYNLFEREIERDILPDAKRHGLMVLAYGALCRGLLTGKITEKTTYEGGDLRKVDPKFRPPRLQEYLTAVGRLDAFARERYGKTVLALAVRWILDAGHTIALWGARKPSQLQPINDVIGPSSTQGAVRPQSRRPAMNVCVPHRPKGAKARSLSPHNARPRNRVIFVLVEVSSTKTRRCGVIRIKGSRLEIQNDRAAFTSARSCSVASSVFFIGKSCPAKQPR